MPINVNPGNFSGLAAVAGRNTGGLGLKVPGSGLLGWKQLAQQRQNQQMAGLTGLGKSMMAQDMANQDMALKERAMALQEGRAGQQADLAERGMDLKERALAQAKLKEEQRAEMAGLVKQEEADISEQGNFAATARISMEDVTEPAEARALQEEITSEAAAKGYITEEEAKQLSALPVSRFKSALDFKIMQLGKVAEYQKMRPKKGKAEGKGGTIRVQRPDGTVIEVVDPSSAAETSTQKELMDREIALKELAPIRKGFNENYFTWKGRAGLYASKVAEKAEGIPGLEQATSAAAEKLTQKSPEERETLIKDATKYLNSVEQFFQQRYRKPITGAQAAIEELKVLRASFLSGDMAPSEFQGAVDNIFRRYVGDAEYRQNVLSEGIRIDKSVRDYYKEQGYSDEQIDRAIDRGAQ